MITNTYICSSCCGQTRKPSSCDGCPYYQDSRLRRKYNTLPRCPLQTMENSDLQDYANAMESELCAFDTRQEYQLKDESALRILELLQDKYYFNDINLNSEDKIIVQGFERVNRAIGEDLPEIPDETISMIIATIYFVAKRRTEGHREYLDFIHEYVGTRLGTGIRALGKKDL